MREKRNITVLLFIVLASFLSATAQISPGELSTPHANLEGLSNCTKCHVLGNKVSNEKCLACHTEIQKRISVQKGYHISSDVKGKQCTACHSDHHGKNFQLIRFEISRFDHNLTGYPLSIPHAKKECKECHSTKNIADQNIRAKNYTYLGTGDECINCHTDYHQKSLSSDCLNCHNADSFRPATRFNHSTAKFKLVGKHITVDCSKCHRIEMTDGKKFQKFKGLEFADCNSCHKDPHQNKFGRNCSQCHSEDSFKAVKVSKYFDHNKTDFKLVDKHLAVNCQSCHKSRFTDPLKHDRCTDCHADYHKKQFVKNGVAPDCSKCHNEKGFTIFSYTIEQHKAGTFPLRGAHEAIPCIDCHRKGKEWNFNGIGINCKNCHKDVHQGIISAKYYPDANCKICHAEGRWNDITFDHSKTDFILTGSHSRQECRACHFRKESDATVTQKFSGLAKNCTECHTDNHFRQFEKNGITNCLSCHDTETWKASKFNHNNTAFKLDGKHINVACAKCHKPQQEGTNFYIRYKLKEFKCESCHL
jgi:hypothetical protein